MTTRRPALPRPRKRGRGEAAAEPHRAAQRLLSGSRTAVAAYLLPGSLVYGMFVFLPVLASACLSFTEWDGLSWPIFVGLGNYLRLVADGQFWTALGNNAILVFFYTVLPLLCGLVLTAALGVVSPQERSAFRLLAFLPYVMSMALIGIIWQWLYNPAFGPIAHGLRAIGAGDLAIPFLGSFTAALPSVGLVATWSFSGFCLVLLLSGVQRLDPNLAEAAALDGASRWQTLRRITLPLLIPEIRITVLLTMIACIKAFDLIFVMTRGGPGTSTLVTSIYMYENAFRLGAFGYSATIAMIGAALVLIVNRGIQLALRDW